MTSVVVLSSAKASGHLENASLHVRMYLAPDDRLGLRGPTMSICSLWKGYPAVGEHRVCL